MSKEKAFVETIEHLLNSLRQYGDSHIEAIESLPPELKQIIKETSYNHLVKEE